MVTYRWSHSGKAVMVSVQLQHRGGLTWAGGAFACPAGAQQLWGEGLLDLHLGGRGREGNVHLFPSGPLHCSQNKILTCTTMPLLTLHVWFQVCIRGSPYLLPFYFLVVVAAGFLRTLATLKSDKPKT